MLNDDNLIDVDCIQYVEFEDDNVLSDDVIYEINDNLFDDTDVVYRKDSSKLSDNISEKTCSLLSNDLETILFDYTIIIDCLTSTPFQRSESQISILSQLLQSIPIFMCINGIKLEYICQAAKLICLDRIDQIIIRKYSVLSEWFFCLEGSLRKEDNTVTFLGPGGFIGTDLWSQETLISDYDLFSNSDHCKLLMIGISDLESSNKQNNLIIKTSDEDKSVIAVYEACTNISDNNNMYSYVLIKGTIEVLVSHLCSNPKWVSEDFVEDFFLTHKLFLNSANNIKTEIYNAIYLENEYSKDKFDIFIRWLAQSFPEFEKDLGLLSFINEIIKILKSQNNDNWLYILYECCSNSAAVRDIEEIIRLQDYTIPVKLSEYHTIFYFHQVNSLGPDTSLRNGDVIMELGGYPYESITLELIKSLSEERKMISMSVRNDLLGYHEHILKDISIDSVSVYSTPSTAQYSSFCSEKLSDTISLSANDSDNSLRNIEINANKQKGPVILPNLFNNLQSGTIGRFFKTSKHYAKTTISCNSRSNSDVAARIETLQNGNKDLSTSNFSISRFSRRLKSKRRRQSFGSNVELIKSFDDLELNERSPILDNKAPIRICFKDIFLSSVYTSSMRYDLRFFHFLVDPSTTVTEVIIRTLLKLNVTSASSTDFHLVEVKINEKNAMVHEKILHPSTSNLIDRLKEHSRFYLKHRSFVGESLLLPSEADRMKEDLKTPSLLQMTINTLAVRLFLRSFRLLCKIQASELLDYVNDDKTALKYRGKNSGISEYIHLSDFYKYWVITEICSVKDSVTMRASTIKFFIHLALKAMHLGHIDLFFSLISGLDSMDVLRLNMTWEKISKRDKKLFQNLKSALDVSGNMRNLRIIHQNMLSPIIPVTAMTVKDLTMLEETHHTYVSGMINGLQSNHRLVNFDKMRKMSKIARTFVNSCCSCQNNKSRPVRKHMVHCKMKWENKNKLERFLYHRLEHQSNSHFQKLYSHSLPEKHIRKYSFSNMSSQNSSSESLSESISSPKCTEEKLNCQVFEQRMMTMKIERYLNKIKDLVITDPWILSDMSLVCEPSNHIEGMYETKIRNSTKYSTIDSNFPFLKNVDPDVPCKAVLGIKAGLTDNDDVTNVSLFSN